MNLKIEYVGIDSIQPYENNEISDDSFYKVKLKSIQSLIGANTNGKKVNEYLYSNQEINYDKATMEEQN